MNKHTIKEIIKSIICIPFFIPIFIAGVFSDELNGILRFYYPLFFKK